ncbi:hypothetical protein [Butyrivibrio hungatei]|uniref:Uncharacterized protein n=1 Tax=Butyrivibrio hungatei TaxID=185008 RepID=A0A1D9P6A9_9FIRM|nr:hypothetical protein [Butyrivibrio hungatei]AOZ97844.1 hypothetical protein bhn_II045 [Butyrivibrio hungatei]
MNASDKNRFWSAMAKLSAKDRIALFIGFVVVVSVICAGIFHLVSSNSLLSFSFPDSTLASTDAAQTYRRNQYDNFPTVIRFPNTLYGACATGELYYSSKDAVSFKDEQFVYVYGVKDASVSTAEAYAFSFSSVLDGMEVSSTNSYASAISDNGYINATYATYEAGTITSSGKEYYVVSYQYRADGKDLVLLVATDEKDKSKLIKAKKYLEKMFYTLTKFDSDATSLKNGGTNSTGSSVGKVTVVVEPDAEGSTQEQASVATSDMSLSSGKTVEQMQKELDEHNYHILYPNAVDLDRSIDVTSDLANSVAIFFFRYVNTDITPKNAYLLAPDGTYYKPSYWNENNDGMICFKLANPIEGTYTMHISSDGAYGTYIVDVMDESVYDSIYGDNSNPMPHDMDE